jgi:uncharacterized protein involved in outer membrane biogenesis
MKPRTRRLRAAALTAAAIVVGYGILGALVAPPIAKKLIADRLGERLGRTVALDRVSINPYTLRAVLGGFRILEPDGKTPFASFETLDVDGSIGSLYRLAPVIDSVTLTGLRVHLVRDRAAHYNVSDLLPRLMPATPKRGEKREPARFSVGNIRLKGAALDFDDLPNHAQHRIANVQVTVPFVSNLPTHLKDQVQPSFSADVNGTPVTLSGEALPFEDTIRTRFDLDVRDLDLPRYVAYLPADVPFKLDSGKLDARLSFTFIQAANRPAVVNVAGTAALENLALSTAEGPLARVKHLAADISSLDPFAGTVKVASVRLAGASAMQDGWTIASAEAHGIDADLEKHSVNAAALTTADGQLTLTRRADGAIEVPRIPPSEHPAKWVLALAKLDLSRYAVTVIDATVNPAATHRIVLTSLEAADLSTESGFKGSATTKARIGKEGALDASAKFALDPLSVQATLDARSIDVVPLRAYFAQFPAVALKSGFASAKGTLSLEGAPGALRVGYAGSAEIERLATLDTINHEELLDWRSLRTQGIKLAYAPDAPLELAVAEVAVDKAYSRIFVTPQGKLNVQELRTAAPAEREATPSAAPVRPRNVRIDRITFADSRLNFTDHYIKPNYTADVGELHGSVTRLSSDPASRAAVALEGRWDAASPVVIAGTINPLRGDLFLDIGAKGQDIELAKLTAYSERYAGYGIKDGRLTLDVKYHIDNGKLEGHNRILVDRLTFGDKVESPDATKLPVLFLVNLLKDAKGRINVELPISGSLEDPKFEIGALIGQVFGGFFKSAAASPFALLGAGSGGKDGDLAFVEFEPGRSELTPAAQKKLEALVKALQDRPGLKLELAARLDPVKDLEALKAAALQRKLAQAPKDLPKEAREKLAREPVEVDPGELPALSAARAEQVKAYLVANGRLPPERVAVASEPAPAIEGSKAAASRVDFTLH